ncbi:MAG TPA: hypothetical protein VHQ23_07690 [Ilumatobacteraceae bacterium]|jgi:hypothetical protein|nr:hypothetical protein [Ilumatobacteraceae bacterium]
MTSFQAFAVRGKASPVVTLQAGVDFGGYYWTTTSRRAAKVAALRRDTSTSVLSRRDGSWRLRVGRGLVLDPSRAPEAMRDLPVYALAGTAVALIAVRYPEQVLGYVADGGSTPKDWRLHQRVLIAVRPDEELVWNDDGVITHRTDQFRGEYELPESSGRRTERRSIAHHDSGESLLDFDGKCWIGLDSRVGPIALPGAWSADRSAVDVEAVVLAAVNADLPGRACVTIDDSESLRPSDKSGIIARADASLSGTRAGVARIAVAVDSTTTWNGFRSTVAAA